jgi:HK97 family phage major capsid protein
MADDTQVEIKQALDKITDQVKEAGEKALAEAKKAGDLSTQSKEKVDELLIKHGELQARLAEVEQKAARRPGGDEQTEFKTVGQRVVESEAFKGMNSSAKKSMTVAMERKDLMNVTATVGAGVSAANSLVLGDRQPGIIAQPERKMTIRDLLMPGQTDTNSVEYVRETGFTNNAATVAEGATRAKSNLTFDLKTAPIRTIAHMFKASRQLLDDAKGLASYIDGRARYGLGFREELQFLFGDGTGTNILGIVPQASAFAPAITLTAPTAIDKLRLAMLQAVLAEYAASGFVLNPIDWTGIELTKDEQGRYIVGSPINGSTPRLWGLPVVETQAMTAGTFLTGAFNLGAQVFDRQEVEVLLSTENVDDFEKNMVSIRAEERAGLAVYRPESFVTGSLA